MNESSNLTLRVICSIFAQAYGISRTPLLFRYRTVAEVPRSYFVGRRNLYCRIIGVHRDASANYSSNGNEDAGIHLLVRHLSPIGALLPTSWFESLMRISPSNRNFSGKGDNAQKGSRELLKLQIAGVVSPPLPGYDYDPTEFLERLAKKRTLVSCQLLGRSIVATPKQKEDIDSYRNRNQLPSETNNEDTTIFSADLDDYQVALCRLTYRPRWQFFSTDVAEELVREGNANVASTILNYSSSATKSGPNDNDLVGALETKISDTSQRIQDIRRDVKYLEGLETCEFEAAQKSKGMWSVPEIRQMKKEIVDEVDFQAKANPLQKLWRMIRGG